MFRANKPGSVCCVQAVIPAVGEQGAAGVLPLTNALPGLSAFFALELCHAKGAILMAARTDELELCLHRPSNYVECQLQDLVCELLAASRAGRVFNKSGSATGDGASRANS